MRRQSHSRFEPARPAGRYILGSRSPRRLELLRLLVPEHQIEVIPPRSPDEPGFEGIDTWEGICAHLQAIARAKAAQVAQQVPLAQRDGAVVIAADTAVIVDQEQGQATGDAAAILRGRALLVLGQPPADSTWRDTVREWFCRWYAGRTHIVATAVRVEGPAEQVAERVVTSAVTFRPDVHRWLDWYLATDEPLGKAGGYALQGAASVFVERVEGSLSNVVGLPLEALLDMLPIAHPRQQNDSAS
uniref:dTTP/UTP pyrophosphatase n=1 Tax=Schlesneria paludicola TaxID=360056 RepID=A0A7C4QLR5_9PLAN